MISRPSPLSAGIGIGFYGNSETSDGVSQLSSALLHANHTLSAIDHLVRGQAAARPIPEAQRATSRRNWTHTQCPAPIPETLGPRLRSSGCNLWTSDWTPGPPSLTATGTLTQIWTVGLEPRPPPFTLGLYRGPKPLTTQGS